MVSILHMRKRMLGELAYLTRAGSHLTSVIEEVRSWAAWLQPGLAPTTHPSEEGLDFSSHLDAQIHPQRTLCWWGQASSLSSLSFFRKADVRGS